MSNMVVRTNINALNSHRNLGMIGTMQARASSRLSSGYRINSAADDAAGLAISEKMRGQIRGLDQAARNAQDGVSLIQTAEGALSTISDMVVRIRDLIIQASNDPNAHDPDNLPQSDRMQVQREINQLMEEIDAISTRTEFNTRILLNGDLGKGKDAVIANKTNENFDPTASSIIKAGSEWHLNQAAFEYMFEDGFDTDVTDKMNIWAAAQGIPNVATFDEWVAANADRVGDTVATVQAPFSPAEVARIISTGNHRDEEAESDFGTLRDFLNGLIKSDQFTSTFKAMGVSNADELMTSITFGPDTDFVGALNNWGGLNGNAALGAEVLTHLDEWAYQYITNGGSIATTESLAPQGVHFDRVNTGPQLVAGDRLNGQLIAAADILTAGIHNNLTLSQLFSMGGTLAGNIAVPGPGALAFNADSLLKGGDFPNATVQLGQSVNGVQVTTASLGPDGWHRVNLGLNAVGAQLAAGMNLNGTLLTLDNMRPDGAAYAAGFRDNMTLNDIFNNIHGLGAATGLAVTGVTGPDAAAYNITLTAASVRPAGAFANRELQVGDFLHMNGTPAVLEVTEATLRDSGTHFRAIINETTGAIRYPSDTDLAATDATFNASIPAGWRIVQNGDRVNNAGPLTGGAGFMALIGRSEFQSGYGLNDPGTVHLSFLDATASAKAPGGGIQTIAERIFDVLSDLPAGNAIRNDLILFDGALGKVMAFEDFEENKTQIVKMLSDWLKDEFGGFGGAAFIYGQDVTPDNAFTTENMLRALIGNPLNPSHDGQGVLWYDPPGDPTETASNNNVRRLASDLINAFDAWAKDYTVPEGLGLNPGMTFNDFNEWTQWAFSGRPGDYYDFADVAEKLTFASNGASITEIIPGLEIEILEEAVKGGEMWFHIGANMNQGIRINIEAVNIQKMDELALQHTKTVEGFSVAALRNEDFEHGKGVLRTSGEEINWFIAGLDAGLAHVTAQRAHLGAVQNRLEFTIDSLNITSENLSAAESRIRDADMAKEMMTFTQANVLQQAAMAMLAQANQAPNQILSLLR